MLKLNELNEDDDKEMIRNKFMQEASKYAGQLAAAFATRICKHLVIIAENMHNFDHPHIIKLIGICSDSPCFIVMELAEYGQLRQYLQMNVNNIELSTLILYCYQLNTAMSYLESKSFVHR
jgi:serine/threonine protein kinase